MADRYTYLPLVGVFIMLAWGVPELLERRRLWKAWLAPAALAVTGVLSICTWFQVGYWESSITLFEHATRVTKNNRLAHFNLGSALMEGRNDEAAVPELHETLRIDPRFFPAHQNLEIIYARQGNVEAALRHHAAAQWIIVELERSYRREAPCGSKANGVAMLDPEALGPDSESILEQYGRGMDLALQGRMDEALPHLEEALRLEPDFVEGHLALGSARLIQGRPSEATEHYREALRLRPGDPGAHYRLGAALMQEGRFEEALQHFAETLRRKPQHRGAKRLMQDIQAQQRSA
jgi:tetratricopeptide (TPR) repeat protein